jgi:hypothetical protein
MPLKRTLFGDFPMHTRFTLLASAALFSASALAADVTLTPPAGGNVLINAEPGKPALVVQPGQRVQLPGLAAAPEGDTPVCRDGNGVLTNCAPSATNHTITSKWFTLPATAQITYDNSIVQETTGDMPAFTQAVLDGYDIHVYMALGLFVLPLPYTSHAGGKPSTISYRVSAGKLHLMRFTHDNSGDVPLAGHLQYRYVMTPRGALGPGPSNAP